MTHSVPPRRSSDLGRRRGRGPARRVAARRGDDLGGRTGHVGVREPETEPDDPAEGPGWAAQAWHLLRDDTTLRRFVLVRSLLLVSALSPPFVVRSEEHTSELQSLMRISYAFFCLKKKKKKNY